MPSFIFKSETEKSLSDSRQQKQNNHSIRMNLADDALNNMFKTQQPSVHQIKVNHEIGTGVV